MSVLRLNLDLRFLVHLVGYHDTIQLLAWVLLFNASMPVMEQSERLLVSGVVDEHDLISLAQQIECNVLEYVLASNVNQVQLDLRV